MSAEPIAHCIRCHGSGVVTVAGACSVDGVYRVCPRCFGTGLVARPLARAHASPSQTPEASPPQPARDAAHRAKVIARPHPSAQTAPVAARGGIVPEGATGDGAT